MPETKDTRCGIGPAGVFGDPTVYPYLNLLQGRTEYNGPPPAFTDGDATAWYMDLMTDRGVPEGHLNSSYNNNANWGYCLFPLTRHYPEQVYVLRWQGTGALTFWDTPGIAKILPGSTGVTTTPSLNQGNFTVGGTNVRFVFIMRDNQSASNMFWRFPNGFTYTNMSIPKLYLLKFESYVNEGKIFNPDYIDYARAGNFRWYRHMMDYIWSWSSTNAMPFTLGPKEDHFFWCSYHSQFPREVYVPEITSTNGYQYTCPKPGIFADTIQPGETIWGRVLDLNRGDLGKITLNIGNRGAKRIMIGTGWFQYLSHEYNSQPADNFPNYPQLGRFRRGSSWVTGPSTNSFHYDKYYDAYIMKDGPPGGCGQPLSVRVKLCNEIGCGLWYNFVNYTPASEAKKIAKYIAENLDHGLHCLFEYGNEAWGGVRWTDVYCTSLGREILDAGNNNPDAGLGLKVAELMPAAVEGWAEANNGQGRDRDELHCAVMSSLVNNGHGRALGVAQGWHLAHQSNGSYAHMYMVARKHIDCIGFAAYNPIDEYNWRWGGLPQAQYLLNNADLYTDGDERDKDQALRWMYNMLIAHYPEQRWRREWFGLAYFTTPGTDGSYHDWEAACAGQDSYRTGLNPPRPPIKFTCYEGGITLCPPGAIYMQKDMPHAEAVEYQSRIARMYAAFAQSPYMKRISYDFCKQMADFPHGESQCRYGDFVGGGWNSALQQMFVVWGFAYAWDGLYSPWISQEYYGYQAWNNGEPPPPLPGEHDRK